MAPSVSIRRDLIGRLVARCAWAAMLLIHVPVLVAVLSSISATPDVWSRLASTAALTAVTALFLLKTLDVAWLRIGSSRHSVLVLLLAAAVFHHEVLGTDPVTAPMTVVATATGLELARQSPRLVRDLHALLATGRLSPLAVTGFVSTRDAVCAALLDTESSRPRGPPPAGV